MTTTIDGLLNKSVWIEQPKEGFRVAIDTVLVASAVPATASDAVLDLGCGVGGAMLCIAARVPGVRATGIEIQPDLAALCAKNIERNGRSGRDAVLCADVARYRGETFDAVLANPPFHDIERHDASPDLSKRKANADKEGDLEVWARAAFDHLRDGGTFSMIHRADREAEILSVLKKFFSGVEIRRLHPTTEKPAKRLVIRATKGGASFMREAKPLILHAGGAYGDEARGILWDRLSLSFDEN